MSSFLSPILKKRLNLMKAFNWLTAGTNGVYMIIKIHLSSTSISKSLTAERDRLNFLISNIYCFFNMCRLALIQQNGQTLVRINHHLVISKPSQSYLTLVF